MAAHASHTGMSSVQPKTGQIVVEVGILPTRRVMTAGALETEIATVRVILAMAGHALSGGAFQLTPDMAGFTCRQGGMFPGQRVARQAVIKILSQHLAPVSCIMAGDAVRAQAALVYVVLRMATHAIPGNFIPRSIQVAINAIQHAMFFNERETGQRMIKFGNPPAIHRVAGSAIFT